MVNSSSTRVTLLERLRGGDAEMAWDEFFQRYWRLIYVAASRRGCSRHTAEEIVQDVMLRVFETRDVFRYDPARGRFRDWLGTLVRNAVAQRRRQPSERIRAQGGDGRGLVEPTADGAEPDAAWEAAFEEAVLAALLGAVRREVAPETYQAFELTTLGQLSGAEVARLTGLTRNAVYLARKRVLRRLKEMGASYRDGGQLDERIRRALQSSPEAAVERSVATRVQETMCSRSRAQP